MAMERPRYLKLGGLVAVGFDQTGEYLLTVSHSGRGVFSTKSWRRVAREYELAYPDDGFATGIGPIADQRLPVAALDSNHEIDVNTPDGRFRLHCASDSIELIER